MKNVIKKILGVLMAIAFFVSAAGINHVNAVETGSITINGATADKNYSIYKIFDLTYKGASVSYTIADEWKDFFVNGEGREFIANENSTGSLNPIVVNGKTKYINITEGNIAEFAKKAMAQISKDGISKTDTKKAAGDVVTFSNIALGYYMVHPEGATGTASDANSIVSLTSTVPNGEVNVKGVYPTITKEADKKSADYGEDINYTINSKVPDTTGFKEYTYKLTDTLSSGLNLKKDSIKVEIGGEDVTNNENVSINTSIPQVMEINIKMMKFQDKVGKEVKVTYKACLNENAVIGNDGNDNTVKLEYSNDPKDSSSTDKTTGKENVHTAAIKVIKYEKGKKENLLEGAEFVLKNSEGKYYKLEDGKVTWVSELDSADKKVTNNKGNVEFKGLKNGNYKLEETKAPEGYNKLTDDVDVQIDYKDQTTTKYLDVDVENNTGIQLPGTGGMGTTLFAVIGGSIILYTAISLIRGKLKSEGR